MIPTTPPSYNASNMFRLFVEKDVVCRTCNGGFRVQRKDEDNTSCYLSQGSAGQFNAVLKWTCSNCKNDNYSTTPTGQ